MNRIALAAIALALAPAVSAQLYKYTDKDGKTVYTDQPPANVESKPVRVQSAPPPAPPKTALEKDKELDKGRKEAADKAKKGEQAAKREADNEQRCADARSNYQLYDSGGRIAKRNAQGERVFLEQAEIDAEKQKARAVMDEACKKS
jgi:hypothetical protein